MKMSTNGSSLSLEARGVALNCARLDREQPSMALSVVYFALMCSDEWWQAEP